MYTLSTRGRAVGAQAVQLIAEANEEFLRPLTAEEKRLLFEVIGKLRQRAAGR